jgi:glycosyltransferase involved in cell wall biosynthesis
MGIFLDGRRQNRNATNAIGGVMITRPIRILHVVGGMDRGGVETWLMHVLRNIDREHFRLDFLVHTDRRCAYDDEIESLGSSLHVCPFSRNPLKYARSFVRILREHGPYDVVHSHVHHSSGLTLRLAKREGVRIRIAHSHNDTRAIDSQSPLLRRLQLRIGRRWIQRYASRKIAASSASAACLFGAEWRSDPTTSIVYCGIDLTAFGAPADRASARLELGIAPDEFVIGHVGRFDPQKNHDLLLQIHAEVLKLRPEASLLMVGKGPLEPAVLASATRLGIAHRMRFAGVRRDVASLMLGVMDIFVMPSLHEGLPLASLEAQAAGLPTILSDRIAAESDTHCGLAHFIALEEPACVWAWRILQHADESRIQQVDALALISQSHFNIRKSVEVLCQLYC